MLHIVLLMKRVRLTDRPRRTQQRLAMTLCYFLTCPQYYTPSAPTAKPHRSLGSVVTRLLQEVSCRYFLGIFYRNMRAQEAQASS